MNIKDQENFIKTAMKNLEITREQALQMLHDDEMDIETPEMKEVAKKAKAVTKGMAGRKVDAYGKASKRVYKADEDKRLLIKLLSELLENQTLEYEVTNIEREINFKMNNRRFRIILSAPRK